MPDYRRSLTQEPKVEVRVLPGHTVTKFSRVHTAGQHLRITRAEAARLEKAHQVERVR